MASQKHFVKLRSTVSKYIYCTRKNRKSVDRKIEFMKFDPTPGVRKHVLFKEAKK